MSNPFDNKIKESLDKFEMPYDANAWAEFEKQLPQGGGAATSGTQFSWKAAALVAVLAVSVATIWYLNADKEVATSDSVVTEQVEVTQEQPFVIEENAVEVSEPAVLAEKSTTVSNSEKPRIAGSKAVGEEENETTIETKTTNLENAENAVNSHVPNPENKTTPTTEKTTPVKGDAKPLVARFNISSLNTCVGQEVSFLNESSDLKAKMFWDFGDGTVSNELNPSHLFMTSGNYEVTLRAERDSRSADRMISVTVNPAPRADIEASLVKEGYEAIPFYRFETVLKPNETAFWSFTDGSNAQTAVTNHLFRNAGKPEATLTVKNSFGCSVSDKWNSENRKAFQLLAPTGFSPDGNGNNEVFIPSALPEMGVPFEMVILDQKGQEVYRTSNTSEPWNGKLQNNGNKLDAGIYVWTVVLKEEIARKKTFTGTIKLLR